VGAFTTLNLPPLGAGLAWRNNLSLDGSIEVIAAGSPGFASISRSGTNVIFTSAAACARHLSPAVSASPARQGSVGLGIQSPANPFFES